MSSDPNQPRLPALRSSSVRGHVFAAALLLWTMLGVALVHPPEDRQGSFVGELVEHVSEPEIYQNHGLVLWRLGSYFGALGLALLVSLLFGKTAKAARQHRRALRAARARQNNRHLFAAAVLVLGLAATLHFAGLWSLVDRTPRGFEWEIFLTLDLVCTPVGVLWIRSAWRRRGWPRWIRLIASWVTTALPVTVHAFGERRSGVAVLASLAVFFVLVALSAHGLWARRGSRQLIAAVIVFSAGFAVAGLPIWTTVTGARSYVEDATSRGFHETCDFELGVTSAWSVRVPWDPVCPVNEFLPWVYGLNALLGAGLVALGVIGGRRIARRCNHPITRHG